MVQRIAAIDKIFANEHRTYVELSATRDIIPKISRPAPGVMVYKLNLLFHFPFFIYLVIKSRIVYVHSILHLKKFFPIYFFKKVITDLHGAVPEEALCNGDLVSARKFHALELFAVRYSYLLITVSNYMANHLRQKHKVYKDNIITLPIFDLIVNYERTTTSHQNDTIYIIYSGGTQKWQNVDLMIDSINSLRNKYSFIILSHEITIFSRKLEQLGLDEHVILQCVPKSEVYGYYAKADLGFLLRDDSTVNRAACPTKLIEYLSSGIIPIVLQPYIGDFAEYGYCYVTLDQLLNGELLEHETLEKMRQQNYKIMETIRKRTHDAISNLVREVGNA